MFTISTQPAFAEELMLDTEQSTISYEATLDVPTVLVAAAEKLSITTDGNFVRAPLDKNVSTLSGWLRASGDPSQGPPSEGVEGEIRIENPHFLSGVELRDDHVEDMMEGDIVIAIDSFPAGQTGPVYRMNTNLTWNGKTLPEVAAVKYEYADGTLTVDGKMKINRRKYDVMPRNGHKFGDSKIGEVVTISYHLVLTK